MAALRSFPPSAAKSEVSSVPFLGARALFSLNGKVALVTGGGTGIGSFLAKAFVENGAKVFIASRKMSNLTATADALNAIVPNSCQAISGDVSSKSGCDALAVELKKQTDRLDILVNNSGFAYGGVGIDNVPEQGWDRTFYLNVKALFYLTVALLPLLEKGKTDTNTASVINISSVYSFFPSAFQPTVPGGGATWSYGPSKAAAAQLTKMMAASLMKRHVTVNAILPGYVATPMTKHAPGDILSKAHPSGRMSSAVDMAGIAVLYASPAGAHITGTLTVVDGGMTLQQPDAAGKDVGDSFRPKRDANGTPKL
ncbi:putative NADPH-dependent beta-ketoacyl reductase [Tilletiaria anomala UBC 951]|uniref:Putative NADPH-dependent beta-ketoacyl reductase n=1 Tax=Tilletiaria anomala (strain ATCC 24038 / CBS 436.72 / UBC 951) TaxID=1037660 RepID=A0A066VHB4_TILAU|nr:putative NADPH-dependent beta-ketoacyl reductase [Tilletiaria anomala UBC 951]KDN39698.1 putative NADPH-dependent beta-ketoacyl reductase [Tilletiaria anomala UBC 951]